MNRLVIDEHAEKFHRNLFSESSRIVTGPSPVVRTIISAPNCPVAGTLPAEVEAKVRAVPGVTDVRLDLVWDPPWDRDRMSEAARLQLGFDIGFDIVPATKLRK